jgi:hypothetical protein
MMRSSNTAPRSQRGSVLVPVVAAMLVLSLAGNALADLFGAQRIQAALSVESTQAFWIAEGGAWAAAHQGADVPIPVSLGSGTFSVTVTGNTYASTGLQGSARRLASLDFVPAPAGPGGGSGGGTGGGAPPDPLDVGASVATAVRSNNDKLELNLVGAAPYALVLASFSLSADVATEPVDKLKLEGREVWKDGGGASLPTGDLALNRGELEERLLEAGTAPVLRIEFKAKPSGTVEYTLVLRFTNGTSATLVFPISW